MSKHYDYLAIGGGSGGIASINRAAMYGQKCALIEAKALGGTCVNVGCVPKKVMWHAAQIREAIHLYGPDYGFDTTINHFDWEKLVASRSAYIDRIHTSYDNVLGKNNVDVIKGFARFVDAHTVEVNGEIITAFDDILTFYKQHGLFDRYRSELEYLAVSNLFIAASVRVLRMDVRHPLLTAFHEYMHAHFPACRENTYLRRAGRKTRLIFSLLEKKRYKTLALLFRLNDLRRRRPS